MKPTTIKTCKTHDDFTRATKKQGATIQEGGNHTLIVAPKGKCAVPRHKGDLATGTRHAIVKTLLALGFIAFAGIALIQLF